MEQKINSCPEFPYFGASYPDACCIDGYLWDLDKFEDGMLYGGGDEPCPFCNAASFIEANDNGEEGDRERLQEWVNELHKKHNYVKSTDGDSTTTWVEKS